jgi:hypothetical protein
MLSGLVQLRLAHVFDLFGKVFEVELVRQVPLRLGEAAQGLGLLLRPSVDVLVVEGAAVHGRNIYAQNVAYGRSGGRSDPLQSASDVEFLFGEFVKREWAGGRQAGEKLISMV